MVKFFIPILFSLFLGKLSAQILVGPYAPPAEQLNSTAIYKDSTTILDWAISTVITRGPQDISNTSLGNTSVGDNHSATGKSGVNGVVSLGDGGSATLTFNSLITNGPGADFAVFENSFSDDFLELAFVEVSSDGINFHRFEATTQVSTEIQTPEFGTTDATELYNFAGKYRGQYGTPFDLDELEGIAGLNINAISHVKVIDVVGNINPEFASYDSQNNPVNDPWPTPYPSGGFDLDAVGIINTTPTSIAEELNVIEVSIFPNPTTNVLHFDFESHNAYTFKLSKSNGKIVLEGSLSQQINLSNLKEGIYFMHIFDNEKYIVKKIIKSK
jgi:hypothetical protein